MLAFSPHCTLALQGQCRNADAFVLSGFQPLSRELHMKAARKYALLMAARAHLRHSLVITAMPSAQTSELVICTAMSSAPVAALERLPGHLI